MTRCGVNPPLMSCSRTKAIKATALLVLLAALLFTAAAGAQPHATSPVPERIIFPVVGSVSYTDDFGAPRPQGYHQGNDIMAAWRAQVVAAEAGTVKLWTGSARAGCMLWLYGKSGTRYTYIHLNNDLTPRSDDAGGCVPGVAYAPDLVDGQAVKAGQLLGFVGDSGGTDHLHFEIRSATHGTISPYRTLRRARKLLFAVPRYPAPEGLALQLGGTVLWTKQVKAGMRLAVRARDLRASDGSHYRVKRRVVVTVPADAAIMRMGRVLHGATGLASARAGEPVTVFTVPTRPTLSSALAKGGFLEAERIVLGPPAREGAARQNPARSTGR